MCQGTVGYVKYWAVSSKFLLIPHFSQNKVKLQKVVYSPCLSWCESLFTIPSFVLSFLTSKLSHTLLSFCICPFSLYLWCYICLALLDHSCIQCSFHSPQTSSICVFALSSLFSLFPLCLPLFPFSLATNIYLRAFTNFSLSFYPHILTLSPKYLKWFSFL